MRLAPRSLGGQIALLVAVALLVAQAINLVLLLRERERQILVQTTAPAIARLAQAVERDAAGFRDMLGERVRPLRAPFTTVVRPIRPDMRERYDISERAAALFAEAHIPVLKLHANEVKAEVVRSDMRVDPRRVRRQRFLLLSAQVAGDRWVNVLAPLPGRGAGVFAWLIGQTMILYAVVLFPVLWIGRKLARPLDELRVAADRFEKPGADTPVREEGPDDIRRLIRAFNAMRARIGAMLNEKDRMLGAIGHDLRTPLASLRVRAEAAVEDEAERARIAATIEEMDRMLDDILSLARMGKSSEPETRVDLTALTDAVIEDFRDLGQDVTFEESDRATALVRPNLIKRALRNLIENALKYGERARVRVANQHDSVRIEIDDDGPGIAPDQIERMFEAFTRMESSRSRETGGAGLGLTLARAIVSGHGGRLTLANRPEGGLRATMWVPSSAAA